MPSLAALTIYIFGLSAFNHGVSNLVSQRKALAAKQLPESALPALNGFSVAIIGIGIYYMLAAYQENRTFFAMTLARFISASIFWAQGPAWRIRQDIFERVITPLIIPTTPSESQHDRQDFSKNVFHGKGIWQLPLKYPAFGLILVNKQFCAEVRDVIDRLPNNYHVDIMFLKHHGLWTTWTLPKKPTTRYVDTVTATMRIFEPTDDLDPRFRESLNFRGGDGGPESAVWAFHNLLVYLVTKGPGYLGYREDSSYVVNKITINVVAPTDGASHKNMVCRDDEEPHWLLRRYGILSNSMIPPEKRLAEYMIHNLQIVLRADRDKMCYNQVLYENIAESIIFRVNGEEIKAFDMDEMMGDYNNHRWGSIPRDALRMKRDFRKWKKWVLKRRERMKEGLELDDDRPTSRYYH
ncbi:hypothetical protein FSARC_10209 [Fusarium sarcochroum]|uniref:Uncharacterized protein n=1 Tax=Fusarium sarcochroum TaxID=1208366 RepID=A0A8H4TP48_9HYPO|nr:hypothetical protein FSARC_10209 [Fusarium sarcochroum]